MAFISGYARDIAYLLVFIAFLGIIAPSGKYKQYIDLVLGLLVVLIILKPISTVLLNNNAPAALNALTFASAQNIEYEAADGAGAELLRESFTQVNKKQLNKMLLPYNYEINGVYIDFDETTGEIYEITAGLTVLPGKTKTKPIIEIEPVTVRVPGFGEKPAANGDTDTEEIKNIKKVISGFYNLPVDNIHITGR